MMAKGSVGRRTDGSFYFFLEPNFSTKLMLVFAKIYFFLFYFYFFIHLRYSFNAIDTTVLYHCSVGGIPPPSKGIVGKNRRVQSKTIVRSKRVFPLFHSIHETYIKVCFVTT